MVNPAKRQMIDLCLNLFAKTLELTKTATAEREQIIAGDQLKAVRISAVLLRRFKVDRRFFRYQPPVEEGLLDLLKNQDLAPSNSLAFELSAHDNNRTIRLSLDLIRTALKMAKSATADPAADLAANRTHAIALLLDLIEMFRLEEISPPSIDRIELR